MDRAKLCSALLHDPQVLLMDEAFGALDAMNREKMTVELQRIHLESKKTVLLITHSIPQSGLPVGQGVYYDIDLARPRDLSVMASPQFALYTKTIRQQAFISAMSCSSCSLAGYQNCNRVADQP